MKTEIKCLTKQIIYIIIILMLCNFIIPTYSYAVETEEGGSLIEVIAQFLCFIPDAVINILQEMFVTPERIQLEDETYSIKYSPGIIFSGDVPAFDINFIDPNTDIRNVNNYNSYIIKKEKEYYDYVNSGKENFYVTEIVYNEKKETATAKAGSKTYSKRHLMALGTEKSFADTVYYEETKADGKKYFCIEYFIYSNFNGTPIYIYYDVEDIELTEENIEEMNLVATYDSTAFILKPTIASWYNALRKIALAGLLSALVYVGIKIIQTSSSAKEQSKYKNMLKDWLVALCLLFVLHYIMSITITVVGKINEVVKASSIAANGEDILMTSVRNQILNGDSWSQVLTYVVIYCVLAVYTIIYTIQYFRRTIYLAFLTMIAPLITLTYPLDKIKDSKAQAFDMWIKDYIFFSLIQVVHLLIYYIFLGNAIDLSRAGNWLYAIVAIGFITPAEKLIKKMFGFEKSKTLGAMGAGATGALIMNAIQKMPHGDSKKEGSEEQGESKGGEATKLVRTVGVNPFVDSTEETPTSDYSRKIPDFSGMPSPSEALDSSQMLASTKKEEKNTLKGVGAVAGKYTLKALKGAGRTSLRLGLGATGAVIGFSSGIVQGDAQKAMSGLAIGVSAGDSVAKKTIDTIRTVEKIPEKIDEVVDTWREGAYGKEVAQNAKFDRVFRNSNEYRELQKDSGFPQKDFDKKVQTMLNEGITDTKKMKKILKNHKLDPRRYSMENSIKYSKMAEECPEKILHDEVKFIKFCQDRKLGLSEEEIVQLRKDIINFK